jgi:hypothetical protein
VPAKRYDFEKKMKAADRQPGPASARQRQLVHATPFVQSCSEALWGRAPTVNELVLMLAPLRLRAPRLPGP